METFYRDINGILEFKSIALKSDNSVVEIVGEVGKVNLPLIHRLPDQQSSTSFYSTSLSVAKAGYSYVPVLKSTNIRLLPPGEDLNDTDTLLVIYETIEQVLKYTGNGEIGDGNLDNEYYKVDVEVVDIMLFSNSISSFLQDLGVKDWKVTLV